MDPISFNVQDGDSDFSGVAQITSQCEVIWRTAKFHHFTLNLSIHEARPQAGVFKS